MGTFLVFARSAFVIVFAAALLLAPQRAEAYCRTAACGELVAAVCNPQQPNDCGTPLFWPTSCFGFSIQQDGSTQVDADAAGKLMERAFSTWISAPCSGETPGIAIFNLGPVSCNVAQYQSDGKNANIVMFRDQQWPYGGQGNTLALTTVTFNLDTAEILDADLEINSTSSVKLSLPDETPQHDLLSILTHEAGHMLGLSHSAAQKTTMAIDYVPGDTSLAILAQDDIAAICATYPPANTKACDPDPRNGFSKICDDPSDDGDGCSCKLAGQRKQDAGWWPWLFGMATLAFRHTRTRLIFS